MPEIVYSNFNKIISFEPKKHQLKMIFNPKNYFFLNIKDGKWQEFHIQFLYFPKKKKEKNEKKTLCRRNIHADEMTLKLLHVVFMVALSNLSANLLRILINFIADWMLKMLQQLPLFTLFLGKRLIYLHKCRKHFTQFVQFLFFYLTFSSLIDWSAIWKHIFRHFFFGSHIVWMITFL